MIFISHRGNMTGINPKRENEPLYIVEALEKGFDVEIDVWYKKGQFYLGHDEPQYKVKREFLQNRKLWCHAKNIEALNKMLKEDIHCFWHQEDDVTLTSKGFMWTYPGKKID